MTLTPEQLPLGIINLRDRFVGKKVLIVGDHPHVDRVGTVERLDHTNAGWAFKVKFSDGDGCYVFDRRNWKVLP